MQDQCVRKQCKKTVHKNVEHKKQDEGARLDIGFKGASQTCKSKVQDIEFDKRSRHKFKTLDSTKVQDKGALHIKTCRKRRHMRKAARYMIG